MSAHRRYADGLLRAGRNRYSAERIHGHCRRVQGKDCAGGLGLAPMAWIGPGTAVPVSAFQPSRVNGVAGACGGAWDVVKLLVGRPC